MSDDNRTLTEQELWDVLTDPVVTDAKPEPVKKTRPKSGPRFATEAPIKDVPPAPVKRKPDGFFFACMAGVAAVSVAATLVISGMPGSKSPGPVGTNPPAVSTIGPAEGVDTDKITALEQENDQLREQIKDLQSQLLDLSGGTAQLPTSPAGSDETAPQKDPQAEAYDIFNQIRDAYADFDRETLDHLILEMDKRLTYLSSDALNEYYRILEYVEMPSNG